MTIIYPQNNFQWFFIQIVILGFFGFYLSRAGGRL